MLSWKVPPLVVLQMRQMRQMPWAKQGKASSPSSGNALQQHSVGLYTYLTALRKIHNIASVLCQCSMPRCQNQEPRNAVFPIGIFITEKSLILFSCGLKSPSFLPWLSWNSQAASPIRGFGPGLGQEAPHGAQLEGRVHQLGALQHRGVPDAPPEPRSETGPSGPSGAGSVGPVVCWR